MTSEDMFRETLDRTRSALEALVTGDPTPFLALWSQRDDVTVMGGFGGHARGWDQIRANTAFAASRFGGGQIDVEPLATGESDDLAYAVWFEHVQARVAGQEDPARFVVRVTQIFRREDGDWKLIHRHGDQVAEKTR